MQDVNVELSQSSTGVVSLNDANVRSLFEVLSGTISLSDGYGKPSNWFSTITGGTGSSSGAYSGVAVDSSGNIYGIIENSGTGSNAGILVKQNSSGSLEWAVQFPDSSFVLTGVVVDSMNNNDVVVSGNYYAGSTPIGFLARFNSLGQGLWQTDFYIPGDHLVSLNSIAIDSAGSVYGAGVGFDTDDDEYYGLVVKCTSAGGLSFKNGYKSTTPGEFVSFACVCVNNTPAAVYVGGTYSYYYNPLILKMGFDGSELGSGYINEDFYIDYSVKSIALDDFGSVYLSATALPVNGETQGFLCKFTSGLSIDWSQLIPYVITGISSSGGSVNVSCNTSSDTILFIKYTTGGSIFFARSLSALGGVYTPTGGGSRSYAYGNNFYIPMSNADRPVIFKAPTDGSLIGTYTPFTYSAVSIGGGGATGTMSSLSHTFSSISTLSSAGGIPSVNFVSLTNLLTPM
jgi:hypothetical protein